MYSYQHSLPGEESVSINAIDTDKSATLNRRQLRQGRRWNKPYERGFVWFMVAVLLAKVCGEMHRSRFHQEEFYSATSFVATDQVVEPELLGSSDRKTKKNSKEHETKSTKNHSFHSSHDDGSDPDYDDGRHHHKHVDVHVHVHKHIKSHHKHVNVHVVTTDDDYTPVGWAQSSPSDANETKQQQPQEFESNSGYDWQKCLNSSDPDCWKNLGKQNTLTPTSSPSLSPSQARPVKKTDNPGPNVRLEKAKEAKQKHGSSEREQTEAPSVVDWKAYGNALNEKMRICVNSNDPDCWKHIFSSNDDSSTTLALTLAPSSLPPIKAILQKEPAHPSFSPTFAPSAINVLANKTVPHL